MVNASRQSPPTATVVPTSHPALGTRRSVIVVQSPVNTGDNPMPTAVLTATPALVASSGALLTLSRDRAGGYFTTRSDGADAFHARTSGIYLRADPGDRAVLDGNDAAERAALIERRLEEWKSLANS